MSVEASAADAAGVPLLAERANGFDGWLEARRLLGLLATARTPGGFGQLDERCRVRPGTDGDLLIATRMTYCSALGALLGRPGCDSLAAHGVQALTERFHDQVNGGYRSAPGQGEPGKRAYQHSFVLLAASTCAAAGIAGAEDLLDDAMAVVSEHFWSGADGAMIESWDDRFATREPYWGANANMHSVEATLACYVQTGDPVWRARACAIADTFINQHARAGGWMLPEHYRPDWQPNRDYNVGHPDDMFRPYGVTIGHLFEWSRLLLELAAAYPADVRPAWLAEASAGLYETAARLGWAVDGAPGFVYTVGWDGQPVVRQRLHWVVAEAVGAAASWHASTGDARYADDLATWLDYAQRHLIDLDAGSWHHELDSANRPAATITPGKPDVYHALQMALITELPVAPSVAARIRRGDVPACDV